MSTPDALTPAKDATNGGKGRRSGHLAWGSAVAADGEGERAGWASAVAAERRGLRDRQTARRVNGTSRCRESGFRNHFK